MSFLEFVVAVPACAVAIYVAARLVTAAYFKSKQQHEEGK